MDVQPRATNALRPVSLADFLGNLQYFCHWVYQEVCLEFRLLLQLHSTSKHILVETEIAEPSRRQCYSIQVSSGLLALIRVENGILHARHVVAT